MTKRVLPEWEETVSVHEFAFTDLLPELVVNEIGSRIDPASRAYLAATCSKFRDYFKDFPAPTAEVVLSQGHLTFADIVLVSKSCTLSNTHSKKDWGARLWWYAKNPHHRTMSSIFQYRFMRPGYQGYYPIGDVNLNILWSLIESKRDDIIFDYRTNHAHLLPPFSLHERILFFFRLLARDDYLTVFARCDLLPTVTGMITDREEIRFLTLSMELNEKSISNFITLAENNELFADTCRFFILTTDAPCDFWQRILNNRLCKALNIPEKPLTPPNKHLGDMYGLIKQGYLHRVTGYLPWLDESVVHKGALLKSLVKMPRGRRHVKPMDFIDTWTLFDSHGWIDTQCITMRHVAWMQVLRPVEDILFLRAWSETRHPDMARFIDGYLELEAKMNARV